MCYYGSIKGDSRGGDVTGWCSARGWYMVMVPGYGMGVHIGGGKGQGMGRWGGGGVHIGDGGKCLGKWEDYMGYLGTVYKRGYTGWGCTLAGGGRGWGS